MSFSLYSNLPTTILPGVAKGPTGAATTRDSINQMMAVSKSSFHSLEADGVLCSYHCPLLSIVLNIKIEGTCQNANNIVIDSTMGSAGLSGVAPNAIQRAKLGSHTYGTSNMFGDSRALCFKPRLHRAFDH